MPALLANLLLAQPARANDFAIMNGSAAADGAYPWFVSVFSGNELCGGTLIQARWVVTAAHCFNPGQSPRTVSVISNRRLLDDASTGQRITASRFIQHPNWNSSTFANDIALIELSQDATATPLRVAPAALSWSPGQVARGIGRGMLAPAANYLQDTYQLANDCTSNLSTCLREAQQQGHSDADIITTLLLANGLSDPRQGIGYAELVAELGRAAVTGLGTTPSVPQIVSALESHYYPLTQLAQIVINAASITQEVREVDLPLVDTATCTAAVGTLTSSMMCAGYRGTPKDTCQGDSGGPLVVRNPQGTDWRLLGITSFGDTCGTNYGVYTKVSQFLDWIGSYVPYFNLDRVFTWGEEIAATTLLRPSGNEHSLTYASYWARLYPNSGTALGYQASTRSLYYYDGSQLLSLGDYSSWLNKAQQAGY